MMIHMNSYAPLVSGMAVPLCDPGMTHFSWPDNIPAVVSRICDVTCADCYDTYEGYAQAVIDEAYDAWDAVEQGYYDDDPNPYHGDYSEM